MATLKYFIKGNRNPSSIYLRLVHGRRVDVTKTTSLQIEPDHWNNKRGEVRKIAAFTVPIIAPRAVFFSTLKTCLEIIGGSFSDSIGSSGSCD